MDYIYPWLAEFLLGCISCFGVLSAWRVELNCCVYLSGLRRMHNVLDGLTELRNGKKGEGRKLLQKCCAASWSPELSPQHGRKPGVTGTYLTSAQRTGEGDGTGRNSRLCSAVQWVQGQPGLCETLPQKIKTNLLITGFTVCFYNQENFKSIKKRVFLLQPSSEEEQAKESVDTGPDLQSLMFLSCLG